MTLSDSVPIEVLLGPDEWSAGLRAEARDGLTRSDKELPPTWLYDERGCDLFEAITQLPEYYPTRAERSILEAVAPEAAVLTQAEVLVELGSGTSEKTRLLLDALRAAGTLRRFVGFDVAHSTLRAAGEAIAQEYPGIEVLGIVGDFRRHLGALPDGGPRLIAFLGGTVGNLAPGERSAMLAELAATMGPGDALLLGTDLVKDRERLVAAYDDAAGITGVFNRNVLHVLNRELDADFDPDEFDHVARFDEDDEWIEMRLRARTPQVVRIEGLDLTIDLDAGEDIRTEISAKFRPEGVEEELAAAGLQLVRFWTDPAGDFALSLSMK